MDLLEIEDHAVRLEVRTELARREFWLVVLTMLVVALLLMLFLTWQDLKFLRGQYHELRREMLR